ncbi:hypothetical protein [Cellulomonas sp. PhB143]|uniref:hypothetical protein n=1 Tax=Cellulomonas sp. PhB143 TaxID=2485186 RepID=UPI000F4925FF|nr:hypothetical protein [Cellulomonas sp. PhB143]ROS77106.1 hypothetical protein EDF32_1101 [Cellulomonas sp. PhB143]
MVGLFFWWAVALAAAVAVLVFAARVTSDHREVSGGLRGFLADVLAGLRGFGRRRRDVPDAASGTAPAEVPDAAARAPRSTGPNAGLAEFLEATQVAEPAYVDPTEITEPLLWARDHAVLARERARTWHEQRTARSERPADGDVPEDEQRVGTLRLPDGWTTVEPREPGAQAVAGGAPRASDGPVTEDTADRDGTADADDAKDHRRAADHDGAAGSSDADDEDDLPPLVPLWAPVRRTGTDGPERISA